MHEFRCAHLECDSRFTASDRNYLMRQVAAHVEQEHRVAQPSQTVLSYLEATCVTSHSEGSTT